MFSVELFSLCGVFFFNLYEYNDNILRVVAKQKNKSFYFD